MDAVIANSGNIPEYSFTTELFLFSHVIFDFAPEC